MRVFLKGVFDVGCSTAGLVFLSPLLLWIAWRIRRQEADEAYFKFLRLTKLRLQLKYVRERSFWTDLRIIFLAFRALLRPQSEAVRELRGGREAVTLVAVSFMVQEAMKAAQQMEKEGRSVEVIDLRTVKPLDQDLILESVRKTGRLVIADGGWKTCGLSAEIGALVAEKGFEFLKAPVRRVTLPDCPAPASRVLEAEYYPSSETICSVFRELLPKN